MFSLRLCVPTEHRHVSRTRVPDISLPCVFRKTKLPPPPGKTGERRRKEAYVRGRSSLGREKNRERDGIFFGDNFSTKTTSAENSFSESEKREKRKRKHGEEKDKESIARGVAARFQACARELASRADRKWRIRRGRIPSFTTPRTVARENCLSLPREIVRHRAASTPRAS